MTIIGDNDSVSFDGEPSRETMRLEHQPESLRELTEEEVVAAARAFWLDEHCERVDEDDEPPLLWET